MRLFCLHLCIVLGILRISAQAADSNSINLAEQSLARLEGTDLEKKPMIEKIVLRELEAKGFTRPLHRLRAKRLQNAQQALAFIAFIREAKSGPELNVTVSRSGISDSWAAPAETAADQAKFFTGPAIGDVPPKIRKVIKWFNAENLTWAKEGVLDLGLLKDKTVILDFWATWCFPCRISMISLRELQERGLGEKAVIIGVTDLEHGQNIDLIESYLNKTKIHFPIAVLGDAPETSESMIVDYGVLSIPRTFLIGPNGQLVWTGNPLADEAEFSSKFEGFTGLTVPKRASPEDAFREMGVEPRPQKDSKP